MTALAVGSPWRTLQCGCPQKQPEMETTAWRCSVMRIIRSVAHLCLRPKLMVRAEPEMFQLWDWLCWPWSSPACRETETWHTSSLPSRAAWGRAATFGAELRCWWSPCAEVPRENKMYRASFYQGQAQGSGLRGGELGTWYDSWRSMEAAKEEARAISLLLPVPSSPQG